MNMFLLIQVDSSIKLVEFAPDGYANPILYAGTEPGLFVPFAGKNVGKPNDLANRVAAAYSNDIDESGSHYQLKGTVLVNTADPESQELLMLCIETSIASLKS
tara:strand:+ start:2478 stop:2786 length:309 start_codon:yes stop_codon:yes gene_type:complete